VGPVEQSAVVAVERLFETANLWHTELGSNQTMKMTLLAAVASFAVTGHAVHPFTVCPPPPPLCEAASNATLVFFGEVLDQTRYVETTETGYLPQGVQAVRFNVIRAFKGVNGSLLSQFFYYGVEARSLEKDARYLVFAHRCRRTRRVFQDSKVTRQAAAPPLRPHAEPTPASV
jgi:hypothetical protein